MRRILFVLCLLLIPSVGLSQTAWPKKGDVFVKGCEELTKVLDPLFTEAGEEARKRTDSDPSDTEAMKIAMDFEKKGYDLYKEAGQKATGAMEKAAFEHLTLMEKHHYELLQETFNYLNDTENWFQQNEGWMFDGG